MSTETDDETDDETTPCPHCLWGYYTMRGASEDGRHGEVTRWQVMCDGCGATGPADIDPAAALGAWLDLSALRARAEAAEAALATARAEGAAAERAAVVRVLGEYRDHAKKRGRTDEFVVLAEVLEVIDAAAHLDQPEGQP